MKDMDKKKLLHIGTGLTWGAVLIGVAVLTESAPGRMLDWEVMWVIIGGFLIQRYLINRCLKK
ncbi:MAG: hypothetical protein WDZ94_04120 [Patescibacteria group bacterium]